MIKKTASLLLLLITVLGLASPTYANNWFNAVGGSYRSWDGSRLIIQSQDSGRSYTFYGTARSCPGRWGAPYDSMSWVMNGNPFRVSVTECGAGMVWVCAEDDYNNSSCSGYSKRYESGYRYW